MLARLGTLVVLALVLTGCGGPKHEDRAGRRVVHRLPPAVVAAPGPKRCVPPGRHLYFQLVRVRRAARVEYLRTGVRQTDLARPPAVQTLRLWVRAKPHRFKASEGTRPWPYGMGRVVSQMTGWPDSWDPEPLPDGPVRFLTRGWNYVFVLLDGRQGSRADIRIGWADRDGRDGEIALGRGVRFSRRC